MGIMAYPDCCAFKLKYDNSYFSKTDLNDILTRTELVPDNGEAAYNNRILIAVNGDQLSYLAKDVPPHLVTFLQLRKELEKQGRTVKRLQYFKNLKSGNMVSLYVVYQKAK